MRFLVTGGSGFVGRHLILTLLAEGDEVLALARSEESAAVVEALGATVVRGDLVALASDPAPLTDALRGVHTVVHAAAEVRPGGDPAALERINVGGTEAVLAAARAAGVRRLVHVSTEAVLADGHPLRHVDESAPYPAHFAGAYGRTKAEAEKRVLRANDRRLRTVAVRPRLVWGPGDTTVLPGVLAAARAGRWSWIAGGRYLTSTCHVDNLCAGVVAAADRGVGGSAYFLTDGAPLELRDFLSRLAATQGVELGNRSLPRPLARWAATALEQGARLVRRDGEPPLTREVLALLGHEVTVDDTRARTELRYSPVVSVEEGLVELARLAGEGSR